MAAVVDASPWSYRMARVWDCEDEAGVEKGWQCLQLLAWISRNGQHPQSSRWMQGVWPELEWFRGRRLVGGNPTHCFQIIALESRADHLIR